MAPLQERWGRWFLFVLDCSDAGTTAADRRVLDKQKPSFRRFDACGPVLIRICNKCVADVVKEVLRALPSSKEGDDGGHRDDKENH
mmetsp:Transcript_2920/g.7285  ORF Transcript_2920/g.7285 Transcript_2920/m.7285 type:complete len:86 (-) Transcript_2920:116-373(-)